MRRITTRDLALSLYAAGRSIPQIARALTCSEACVRAWIREQEEKERQDPPEPLYAHR